MKKRARNGIVRAGTVVVVCAAVAAGLIWRHHPRTMTVGDPLPPVPLSTLDGTPVNLGDSGNARNAVYNVFTSWCPSCNEELPELRSAAKTLARRGIAFVGIDQGESSWQIEQFANTNGVRYPILMDAARLTTSRLGARVIPETIVVRDGVVRHVIVGPASAAEILAAVSSP